MIQSPEVGFTVDRDTVCSGESVVFTDHSKGENPQYYWNVTGRQTNDFVFINGTSEKSENPVIQFNGYGEYVVALTLTNECKRYDYYRTEGSRDCGGYLAGVFMS